MEGSRAQQIPDFTSLEEFQEFWDTHDITEFEDQLREVDFTVDIQKGRHLVAVEEGLLRRIRSAARRKGVSTETLINVWLMEKSLEGPPGGRS